MQVVDLSLEQVSQRLYETEKRFEIMANASPVMLWMARTDGMCTFFNQSWVEFTGRTHEEEWGVGWAENIHFEDLQRCLDTYTDNFNLRHSFEMEYRLKRRDGEYRWILDRGVPRYHPDGSFAGYIGSCVDISEHKQMESELRQALRTKDDFLGMVSHELRTPLTALQLQIDRLLRSSAGNFSDTQNNILQRMSITAERLTNLITTVLQFSRMQSSRLKPMGTKFSIEELAYNLCNEVRGSADRKDLELRTNIASAMPMMSSDPDLVNLIISNLLTNAIKFTDAGFVALELNYAQGNFTIVVRDSGRGIAASDQLRIFEPFEQLEATRQKHTPGVGLGLALVKTMTHALGGQINLDSTLGRGSEFTISLPQLEQ